MRLSAQTFIISVASMLTSSTVILSAMVLSHTLTKAQYGTYKQIWLIFNSISPFIVMGVNGAINYFISKGNREEEKTIVFLANFIISIFSVIAGLALYFGAKQVAALLDNPELEPYLKTFAFYPLFYLSTGFKYVLFVAKKKAIYSAISTIVTSIIMLVSSIVPVLIYGDIAIVFKWIVVGIGCEWLFYILAFNYHYRNDTIKIEKEKVVAFLQYFFSLGVTSLIATYSSFIDKYFIVSYYSVEKYAIFNNGAVHIPISSVVLHSSMLVLFPRLVSLREEGRYESMVSLWNHACKKLSLIIFPAFIFLLIFANELIQTMFSEKYIESAQIFRIYLFAFVFRFTQYSTFLLVFGDLKWHLYLAATSFILNALFNFIFIEQFGFLGPAYGTIIVNLIYIILLLGRSSKLLKTSIFNTLPFKDLALNLTIATLVGIFTSYIIRSFTSFQTDLMTLISAFILYSVVYLGVTTSLKILTLEDVMIFRKPKE